ncbi:MAG: hypothetical protein L7V86_26980 [Verrucomicrobiales bacterium]|nr:hypothetical protein [Verrucomicrobiales bacterium]MDB2347761.1 hypothetical protein [Verrucomicrobiales bacterium]
MEGAGLEMSGNGGGGFYVPGYMKAISSTLLLILCVSLGSISLVQDTPGQSSVPPAHEADMPAEKPSFFSRFRRQPTVPEQQAAQAAPAPKRQFGIRLPRFKKPDLSGLPKPRMPKVKFPKLRKPNITMPKLRWPFKRQQVSRQTIQNYPNGVRNPKLGGAYGVIIDDVVKFYEIGPSQPGGPDARLDRGSLVTIRSNDRAWAYITLRDGRSGYIGLDQVRLASERESPKASVSRPRSSQETGTSSFLSENNKSYAPPALPTAAADLSDSVEVNPLLQTSSLEESAPSVIEPVGQAAVVDAEPQPVDSPEVLFDPILDPIQPSPGAIPGSPQPFLEDPIPSIEEELRAIQEARMKAEEAAETASDEDV